MEQVSVSNRWARGTRKRKREELEFLTNRDGPASKKQRVNSAQHTEPQQKGTKIRPLSGFCCECTNPRRLISCERCFRSFHWNCLCKIHNQSQFENTNQASNNDITSMADITDALGCLSNNENNPMIGNASPSQTTLLTHISAINLESTANSVSVAASAAVPTTALTDPSVVASIEPTDENPDRSHIRNNTKSEADSSHLPVTVPDLVTASATPSFHNSDDDADDNASVTTTSTVATTTSVASKSGKTVTRRTIDSGHCCHSTLSQPFPKRSDIPPASSNDDPNAYQLAVAQWFECERAIIADREALLHSDPSLFGEKEIISVFMCHDCANDTNKCLICNGNGTTDNPTLQCKSVVCGTYYHLDCLKTNDDTAERTKFNAKGFMCPRHHCWQCFGKDKNFHKCGGPFRKCWYCPAAYGRNDCPVGAELPASQIVDEEDVMNRYPPFVFDLINCSPGHNNHPSVIDGQFGRDDEAHGVVTFKFLDKAVQFFPPKAGFFEMNDSMLTVIKDFQKSIQRSDDRASQNPYPPNFKHITKSRYHIGVPRSKKSGRKTSFDMDPCDCEPKCEVGSCANFGLQIECNAERCRYGKEIDKCDNRQFKRLNCKRNCKIVNTSDRGFGAFAGVDFKSFELVLEYVGEVITKEESDLRLKKMNEEGAPHFYFFSFTSRLVIDATTMGNEARFLNHSCDPNCRTELWDVDGESRLGIFATRDIKQGDELTYDYQYQVENTTDSSLLAECRCGADNCRRFLGYNRRMAKELEAKENKGKKKKKSKKKKRKNKRKSRKSKAANAPQSDPSNDENASADTTTDTATDAAAVPSTVTVVVDTAAVATSTLTTTTTAEAVDTAVVDSVVSVTQTETVETGVAVADTAAVDTTVTVVEPTAAAVTDTDTETETVVKSDATIANVNETVSDVTPSKCEAEDVITVVSTEATNDGSDALVASAASDAIMNEKSGKSEASSDADTATEVDNDVEMTVPQN